MAERPVSEGRRSEGVVLPGAQFTSEEEVPAVLSRHGSSRPGSRGPAEPRGVSTPGLEDVLAFFSDTLTRF